MKGIHDKAWGTTIVAWLLAEHTAVLGFFFVELAAGLLPVGEGSLGNCGEDGDGYGKNSHGFELARVREYLCVEIGNECAFVR